jgi:hypothetical protein
MPAMWFGVGLFFGPCFFGKKRVQVFLAVQVFLGSRHGTYGEFSTHRQLMLPLQYQCHNATLPRVFHGITIAGSLSQVRHQVAIAVSRQRHNAMLPGGIAIAGSFS